MTATFSNRLVLLILLRLCVSSAFLVSSKPGIYRSIDERQISMLIGFSQRSATSEADACASTTTTPDTMSVAEATRILSLWDQHYNPESTKSSIPQDFHPDAVRDQLPAAVKLLNQIAADDRSQDSTKGRCMLGICASSAQEGVSTLKVWVSTLELPRGLLHGMDKDGVPVEIDSPVYIKYNTGGVFTFADIRKSGLGFDALWKPGDALLEPYDGKYRGVYFQVELDDGEFRQYLVPLDLFGNL